jgi:myo-inositol 2-dehydrogenase/D-chiro-inositol 1-dehydrogenase
VRIGIIGVGRIGALHAETSHSLAEVDELVVVDSDAAQAQKVASKMGVPWAPDIGHVLKDGAEGIVIATPTDTHAGLVRAAAEAGAAVFCEKPVAAHRPSEHPRPCPASGRLRRFLGREIPGLQRPRHRCRALGHRAGGERGLRHRVQPGRQLLQRGRGCRHGGRPSHPGRPHVGAGLFDRYNAAGYDVRLEVLGSEDSISVGLDDRLPLRSAEPGVTWPAGTGYTGFMDRFRAAYVAELEAFIDVVSGRAANPCTPADALETFYVAEACELSRRERHPVTMEEVRL